MSENKAITGAYTRVCCVRKCPICGADCALIANTQRAQYECVTGKHFFENNHGDIGQQKGVRSMNDCRNSQKYERLPNRCLNEQRLQKLEKCKRHGRNGNIACQFCSISMWTPSKGFTCEV